MINHQRKIIFFHIPKCGGYSVGKYLGTYGEGARTDHRTWMEIMPLEDVLLRYRTYVDLYLAKKFIRNPLIGRHRLTYDCIENYHKVAVVRNPFARIVSWYLNVQSDPRHLKHHGGTAEPFDRFVTRNMNQSWAFRSQFCWLQTPDGKYKVDHILQLEKIESQLSALENALNIPENGKLPTLHMDKAYDWKPFYQDAAVVKMIQRKYAHEFDAFGYELNPF